MMTPGEMVKEFHGAYGVAVRMTPVAKIPEKDLRIKLIKEEVKEYIEALETGDIASIAQELADIVYVVYGAAITHGIDLDAVLAEVHRANMSKLDEDGNPIYREDGKVLKGPFYEKPDIYRILFGVKA
jgi:predicted HAD superfamily Cof-like phosphohydrolase